MATAPGSDVYLSYNRADVKIVRELEQALLSAGIDVFRDETRLPTGADWQEVLTSAISTAAFVAVCVGPTGLAQGQLQEIDAADARAAVDPDFQFAAVLLPGVPENFPSAALPIQLASRQWLDLRQGLTSWRSLVSSLLESGARAPRTTDLLRRRP